MKNFIKTIGEVAIGVGTIYMIGVGLIVVAPFIIIDGIRQFVKTDNEDDERMDIETIEEMNKV